MIIQFILEQLSGLDDISYRAMMGEFILYYRGKIVGGIYDELTAPKIKKQLRDNDEKKEIRNGHKNQNRKQG